VCGVPLAASSYTSTGDEARTRKWKGDVLPKLHVSVAAAW
jgi:hypothetical protein